MDKNAAVDHWLPAPDLPPNCEVLSVGRGKARQWVTAIKIVVEFGRWNHGRVFKEGQ